MPNGRKTCGSFLGSGHTCGLYDQYGAVLRPLTQVLNGVVFCTININFKTLKLAAIFCLERKPRAKLHPHAPLQHRSPKSNGFDRNQRGIRRRTYRCTAVRRSPAGVYGGACEEWLEGVVAHA
ncbi:uncharacterized protein [Gossypium hirsutum]|uniref:Uncharacterized protein n=1 Tax=Gossypium hirsutum TaxID=3635 RepID=A0ABM3AAG6_GOSHI|nr:uncharacterized protein LOC121218552 [Gossypium hirsutum]